MQTAFWWGKSEGMKPHGRRRRRLESIFMHMMGGLDGYMWLRIRALVGCGEELFAFDVGLCCMELVGWSVGRMTRGMDFRSPMRP